MEQIHYAKSKALEIEKKRFSMNRLRKSLCPAFSKQHTKYLWKRRQKCADIKQMQLWMNQWKDNKQDPLDAPELPSWRASNITQIDAINLLINTIN